MLCSVLAITITNIFIEIRVGNHVSPKPLDVPSNYAVQYRLVVNMTRWHGPMQEEAAELDAEPMIEEPDGATRAPPRLPTGADCTAGHWGWTSSP